MKYYLVAGEASGDLHGANLMKELKLRDNDAQFRFFGGDLMASQGGELVRHYADMAYMGIVEVLMNIRTIAKNLSLCKSDIAAWQPDVLILIDFPGFNLKVAAFAKQHNMLVCYYISPKVWAWNQKRVLKIKRVVDHMFCILPFEVDFYEKWGMQVDYVGNPLLDAIAAFKPNTAFLKEHTFGQKKIIALLPGSRKQEIDYLLPDMIATAKQNPAYDFVIAGAPSFEKSYYDKYTADSGVPVIFNATYDLLTNASAAIVASGTATLETALLNVPQVVVYKGNPITVVLGRMLIKLKYLSLVNLIMDKPVVKEFIQHDCSPDTLTQEIDLLLHDAGYRNRMFANYNELDRRMGEAGASAKTAELMARYTRDNLQK